MINISQHLLNAEIFILYHNIFLSTIKILNKMAKLKLDMLQLLNNFILQMMLISMLKNQKIKIYKLNPKMFLPCFKKYRLKKNL